MYVGLVAAASLLVALVPFASAQQATDALPPNPGCSPAVVPVGQANPPGSQLEPLDPIWCFNLNPPAAQGAVSGANDWSDSFDRVTQMGSFKDGDYGYRIFPLFQCQQGFKQQYFTNNQHWMQDESPGGQTNCATMLRPNRSFHFENGKLVVEEDVAAGITGYDDITAHDENFAEIDVSMAPQPTGNVVDSLYGYGQFGGYWSIGCRIHAGGSFICAVEDPSNNVTGSGNNSNCNLAPPARIIEISDFEVCGTTHIGGSRFGDNVNYFRICDSAAEEPDMMCRDRFRFEITATGLTVYVNGHLYFQETGWPAGHQIDPNAIANGQWYVYDANWIALGRQPAYRWHWDNFSVNPHNPDGTFRAPSAAPNFCLSAPMQVCPTTSNTPTPTPQAFSQTMHLGDTVQVTCASGKLTIVTQSQTSDVLMCQ